MQRERVLGWRKKYLETGCSSLRLAAKGWCVVSWMSTAEKGIILCLNSRRQVGWRVRF